MPSWLPDQHQGGMCVASVCGWSAFLSSFSYPQSVSVVCGGLSAFALRILTGVDRPVCLEQFDTLRLLVRSGSPLFSLKKDTAHLVGLLNSHLLASQGLLQNPAFLV